MDTNPQHDVRSRSKLSHRKQLGFTLSEIRDILARREEDSGRTELETGLLPEQISAQISYLERQRSQGDPLARWQAYLPALRRHRAGNACSW
jgi:DNA-binding transcriptional MerR regulator